MIIIIKRIESIAEEKERKNARHIAVKLARVKTLQLVQYLISIGIPISNSFGSDLIHSFLLLSGDVDSSLAILNIVLKQKGKIGDEALELLARKLLSKVYIFTSI
jgi:hypothetical protein